MEQTDNRLYSQIEIIILSKLPPTTVKRWLVFFSDLVPSFRKGDLDYYQFETLELLKRISELRNQKFRLHTIRRILEEEGSQANQKPLGESRGVKHNKEILKRERGERWDLLAELFKSEGAPQALIVSLSTLADELNKIVQELEVLCKE